MSDSKQESRDPKSTYRKKMIEVALPLQAINKASAREKSIRHGHPSTLHLWWARRPLAACRAVLFSSLVNDPGDDPMYGITEERAATERAKLFDLMEELVLWENSNNPTVINKARLEIARSIAANKVADGELTDETKLVAGAPELPEEQAKYLPDPPPEYTPHDVRFKMPGLKPEQVNHFLAHYAPPVLDPFAGGGSIPLEAQRLGLRAYASDLNPVPVLINKALIEIPPKFAGQPPVNPDAQKGKLKTKQWNGAEGLAEDVRYYGKWMRDEAEKRIGHLYPKVKVTQEMVDDGRPDLEPYVGQELTVIAWLWARTVKSSNPAYAEVDIPLVKSFWLSKRRGKKFWTEAVVTKNSYCFRVRVGKPPREVADLVEHGTKVSRGCKFRCIMSDSPIPEDHIKSEGLAGKLGSRLMAVVCEGNRTRLYLSPTDEMETIAAGVEVEDVSEIAAPLATDPRNLWCLGYGLDTFDKLFTSRQLNALLTFSELVSSAVEKVCEDCADTDYAKAIAMYLACAVSKGANLWSSICSWMNDRGALRETFARQALPMAWDYAEANPFSDSGGNITMYLDRIADTVAFLPSGCKGSALQADATKLPAMSQVIVSTDPPYYDNICYADLSDYFYVWLRKCLGDTFPDLFSTMLTPKSEELIATPYRHNGNASSASLFFEAGLAKAINNWRQCSTPEYPTTIFYAFKQSETNEDGTSSTGWETFLAGIIEHGYSITATWPVRTESPGRAVARGTNALASSIILSCVPRKELASMVTRRDFANALRKELPEAIKHLQSGNVAPVDLAQASIGPGMAVFSRYSKVVNADGTPMSVREALQLINQVLDESLVEQESDFDSDTRFALRWYDQYGMEEGPFGDAEVLAKAMAVSVTGVVEAGIAKSGSGKVRLLKRTELNEKWTPATDLRLTMWEATQYLIRRLESKGEQRTAELLVELLELKGSEYAESARELSYRLYQTCERAKRSDEARSYNGLVVAWPEIFRLAMQLKQSGKQKVQGELL